MHASLALRSECMSFVGNRQGKFKEVGPHAKILKLECIDQLWKVKSSSMKEGRQSK